MGRRRRRKVVKKIKRGIPNIFNCPNCAQAIIINIDRKKKKARVTCGHCDIIWDTEIKSFEEKVDVYNRFVDTLMEGRIET
jgi:transcription elongation factor Elf1